jgi:N-acetylmuramoyl-L-alanine amidase
VIEMVARDGWGAAPPKGTPHKIATPVRDLFIHHSAGPDNGAQSVKAIQKFHQQTRGWADIAYTWCYSPKHRVFFVGRGPGIAQAAQQNHNRDAHSLCILGNYETSRLTDQNITDLNDFAFWHGGTWGPDRYRPHRDVSNTACPGRNIIGVLDRLNDHSAVPLTPLPEPVPLTPPTLRRGSTGPDVVLLQAAVMAHDGNYGAQTEQAVREYQRRNGLTVDGICGPNTWASILGL